MISRLPCLNLPDAGITGVQSHAWPVSVGHWHESSEILRSQQERRQAWTLPPQDPSDCAVSGCIPPSRELFLEMKRIIMSVMGAFRDGMIPLISTLDFHLIYVFSKQVLFCSSGWTGTHDVELTAILPRPLRWWGLLLWATRSGFSSSPDKKVRLRHFGKLSRASH